MSYFLVAAIATIIGVSPLLLRKQFVIALGLGIFAMLVLWGMIYMIAPSTVWPLFTPISIGVAILMIASSLFGVEDDNPNVIGLVVGVGYFIILILWWISSSAMFNASTYASMAGDVPTKNWTTIVQPKSPDHIRMMGDETALYIARKAVANAGAIGSQFSIDDDHLTLQRVNGELVYVVPLDFNGFGTWTASTNGVPAYIVINAQDPEAPAKLVKFSGSGMLYTPGAFFGSNLQRYLREHGFLDVGLAEINFEVDDSGNAWWVVPTYRPTVGWDAWKIQDVATVNPVTGEIHRYALDKAPAWIDRIYPASFIKDYLTWRGSYAGGWWNSWWGMAGLTKAEEPQLIYSSDNRAEWVTGITSASSKDDSLVAIAYTDSRTGKTTVYNVDGGATDSAILTAVNANADINYKHLHGVAVQMYNIYGTMAAVVPLLNSSGAYQAVAIASVKNPQDVVWGSDQVEALRNFQMMLFRKGQQVSLSNASSVLTARGVIDRIGQDTNGSGSPYLFHINGVNRIFVASSKDSIKVPLTRPGDTVIIDYVATGEGQVPVKRFENLSLPLDQTPNQAQLSAKVDARVKTDETRTGATDVRKRIDDMSDTDLQALGRKLPQK